MSMKIASAVAVIASLGLSTAAMAYVPTGAQTDVGFITSVDTKDKTVTLSDGNTYQLRGGANVYMLNEGQKLSVDWVQNGATMDVVAFQFAR